MNHRTGDLAYLRFSKSFPETLMPRLSLNEKLSLSLKKKSGEGPSGRRRSLHESSEMGNLLVFALKEL